LYWVELSVCIIPPIIYNLLSPWTYPILGNHVNLLFCVLFVFAFGPVCATVIFPQIHACTLKRTASHFPQFHKGVFFSRHLDVVFFNVRVPHHFSDQLAEYDCQLFDPCSAPGVNWQFAVNPTCVFGNFRQLITWMMFFFFLFFFLKKNLKDKSFLNFKAAPT
jgi:hypothetical protein